jgi:YrbI family 3-deoxy-D-manno-octulosonate 8-phosphate phosphatase
MVNKPQVLALIPARGGSKGIPRKNILDFAGFPLIAWSIEAARRAETVTRVVVSTDDEEIAAISREVGAEVPFLRPVELAQDRTLDLPVFKHTLKWFAEQEGWQPEVVVQLRPTSPVRPRGLVDDAVRQLLAHPEADSVRGVVPSGQNPYKMWRVDPKTGRLIPLLSVEGVSEPYNAPRQALPDTFWQTGHIDAIRSRAILEQHSMSGEVILPLVVDSRYTVDIDSPLDWDKAEWQVLHAGLDFVDPASQRRSLPADPALLVMDFDGVLTDNRVWVDEDGHERIAANRSDSMGLHLLREKTRVEAMVISMETNPVVAARCKKLRLPVFQSINEKAAVLKAVMEEKGLTPAQVIYMGNDVNDLECFPLVGCAVAPVDAQPEVLRRADLVLSTRGGHGAVRELCDLILAGQK